MKDRDPKDITNGKTPDATCAPGVYTGRIARAYTIEHKGRTLHRVSIEWDDGGHSVKAEHQVRVIA